MDSKKFPAVSISIKFTELQSILVALSEYSSKPEASTDEEYLSQLEIDAENIENIEKKYWKAVNSKNAKSRKFK